MHPTLLNREKSASTFRFKDASAVGRRSHPAASDSLPYEDQRISHEESLVLLKRHENPMTQVASRAATRLARFRHLFHRSSACCKLRSSSILSESWLNSQNIIPPSFLRRTYLAFSRMDCTQS